MKKYKNPFVIIWLTLLAFLTISCEDTTDDAETEFSSVVWFTSRSTSGNLSRNKLVVENGFLSFIDASQGVISREWEINDGSRFLRAPFQLGDTVYRKYINPNLNLISNESDAHVFFTKPGETTVNLTTTFSDPVSFNGVNAVKEGDVWVFRDQFSVEVLAKPNPVFTVNNGGTELLRVNENNFPKIEDRDKWQVIEIESGDKLTFEDFSTKGDPNSRRWSFVEGVPAFSNRRKIEVQFFKPGEHISSISSTRNGQTTLTDTQSKYVPLVIKVNPSTKPFVVSECSVFRAIEDSDSNNKIALNLNSLIDPSTVNINSDFSIRIRNIEDASIDFTAEITRIQVTNEGQPRIEFTIDQEILNTDIPTISYTGNTVASTTGSVLESFSDIPIAIRLENAFPSLRAGFEVESNNPLDVRMAFADGYFIANNGTAQNPIFSRTTNQRDSGRASLQYNGDPSVSTPPLSFTNAAGRYLFPGNTYFVSIAVFIPEGTNIQTINSYINNPRTDFIWDVSTIEKGTWVNLPIQEYVAPANLGRTSTNYFIQITDTNNPDVTGRQRLFIDNLIFSEKETR